MLLHGARTGSDCETPPAQAPVALSHNHGTGQKLCAVSAVHRQGLKHPDERTSSAAPHLHDAAYTCNSARRCQTQRLPTVASRCRCKHRCGRRRHSSARAACSCAAERKVEQARANASRWPAKHLQGSPCRERWHTQALQPGVARSPGLLTFELAPRGAVARTKAPNVGGTARKHYDATKRVRHHACYSPVGSVPARCRQALAQVMVRRRVQGRQSRATV